MHDTIRAFIAFDLPEDIILSIIPIQNKLKAHRVNIRCTRPDSIHLTLKFLGDIKTSAIDDISALIQEASQNVPPLSLEMKGMGVFPSFKRPRIVWLGLSKEIVLLKTIQKRLDKSMERVGIPIESKPFRAHLTVGRVKGFVDPRLFMEVIEKEGKYLPKSFIADSITLYQSQLRQQGAIYTPIKKIQLSREF